jgi:hypothetical protein
MGQWSTTYAGSSFKIVTAPSDAQQANAGSSFKIVTAPDDAKQAQAEAPVPHADEPLPGEHGGEPLTREPQANNDVQREQILLPPSTERQVKFSRPFTKVILSDPNVLGILPIGDQSIVLKALKAGNTDILLFNNQDLVSSLEVIVDDSVARRSAVRDREAYIVAPLWPIEIHNKALLTSQTNYRCGADGCHYVNELTATEPAPLPRGWSNQNFNSTSTEGQGAPQVTVPATPNY